jgi:hypothetical protein
LLEVSVLSGVGCFLNVNKRKRSPEEDTTGSEGNRRRQRGHETYPSRPGCTPRETKADNRAWSRAYETKENQHDAARA